MATAEDIGWGSYSVYEGPFYRGKNRYKLPDDSTENDRILRTITATEGGTYDAYNGYDKCICTSGLIQWCDRAPFFLVAKMLGAAAEHDPALVAPVVEYVSARGYTFGQLADKKKPWRFWRTGDGDVVDTQDKQRILYFGGASGLKGQWNDPGQRQVAKEWAAACSSVWEHEEAKKVQRDHTVPRLFGFATSSARQVLEMSKKGGVVGEVFRAAYLSFAVNNPRRAGESLNAVVQQRGISWDKSWLFAVLHSLTFRPKIAIYPHRYNAIRKPLESMFGLDLPDLASDLQQWMKDTGFKGYLSTEDMQNALLELDYDLGPAGADGIAGEKTRAALMKFEEDAGVDPAHTDGYPDQYTMPALEEALGRKGKVIPWRTE